jgi:hypothetical protein
MPSGKYRVQIYVHGVRESRVFRTKREAQQWGAIRKHELRANQDKPKSEIFSLKQALDKYSSEVSPGKRGHPGRIRAGRQAFSGVRIRDGWKAAFRYGRCRPFGTLFYARKKSTSFCYSLIPVPGNTAILSVGGPGIRKRGRGVMFFFLA